MKYFIFLLFFNILLYTNVHYAKEILVYADYINYDSKGNILAKSLTKICYQNNPSFVKFKEDKNLSFEALEEFDKTSIQKRNNLYREISELIWSPEKIDDEKHL